MMATQRTHRSSKRHGSANGVSSAAGHDVMDELDQLRSDMKQVRQDLGKLSSAVVHTTRKAAYEGTQEMGQRIAEPLQAAYESAWKRGDKLAHRLGGKIEAHPIYSLASAALMGMLIVFMLRLLGFTGHRH